MKSIKIILAVAIMAILGNAYANDYLEYILTKDKIITAKVLDGGKGQYFVAVELTEMEKDIFGKITGDNIGKSLKILHKGQVLVKAIIMGKIDSGMISIGNFGSKSEADECALRLLSDYIY